MYILKNALTSIRRNKGRNILIGVIVLVVSCAAAVSLAIKNSASTLIDSYEKSYDIEASITTNREKLMGNFKPSESSDTTSAEEPSESMEDIKEKFNNIESLTVEDINNYGDSDFVSSYYYTYSVGLNSSSIEKVTSDTTNEDSGRGPGGMSRPESSSDFTLIGYSSLEAYTEFINGNYTISDGEVSSDLTSNNCVINEELATTNNLSVGSTIILYNPDDETKTYTLTVTGIFADNNDSENGMNMFSNSANRIITNVSVIDNIVSNNEDIRYTLTPTFKLVSSDVIEKYEIELQDKGLSEYLTLTTNLDEVSSATSSISNVSTFATTFLVITLIIGGVVLFILNMINLRERKYEIGVLRTIGMKKSLLTGQFTLEILIVTIVALLMGTGIGACISVPTANMLLKNEIEQSQNQSSDISKNFGGNVSMSEKEDGNNKNIIGKVNGFVNVDKVEDINAVVNIKVIIELIAIGILLTLISASASMISIQRFSPLTILRERS